MMEALEHVDGTVNVEMELRDWVWLCEILVEMKHCAGEEGVLASDIDHALRTLEAFEDAL